MTGGTADGEPVNPDRAMDAMLAELLNEAGFLPVQGDSHFFSAPQDEETIEVIAFSDAETREDGEA